ncbi:MAG: ATP-binding protein [Thermoguttaceae bacterium]|nr:ATP-binding protein [Thermoguttaceae bacterium]
MLVSFSLENWMSFRNQVTFSMVASRERQHRERVPKLGKYQTRVLPVAAIYGGNASGKTNFFKALSFAKSLVINGTRPDNLIPVEPFRLDTKAADQPSRFSFELLIDEVIYEFSFAVTRKAVLEEKLVVITGNSEKVLYHRRDGDPNFDSSLANDMFLNFAFQGTRDNQLFLTNSVSQKVDNFRPVYDWFQGTLELVAPDSRFEQFDQFLDEGHPFYSTMNEMLRQLDTGISHMGSEEVPFKNIPWPEPMKTSMQEKVKEGMTVRMLNAPINERFVVTRKNGELIAKKLATYHTKADGTEAEFDIRQESDGSQRVIDLLPAFLELSSQGSKKVYVIDELDRSLHSLLTRGLLEVYLGKCSTESRTQLLLTTHDVLLMDQQLLRRDEMWVAERDVNGASDLVSFSEYKDVRYDKDIRKSYLQGRLGGIPRILLGGALTSPRLTEESGGDD